MLLTQGYDALRSNGPAMAAVAGTLAAAVGMMGTAAWELLVPALNRRRWLHGVVIAGSSLILSLGFDLSPILVLALAAVTGVFWRIPE